MKNVNKYERDNILCHVEICGTTGQKETISKKLLSGVR